MVLVLINSINTDAIRHIKKEINSIKWNLVYTFDSEDAKNNNYSEIGYCYYSAHKLNTEKNINFWKWM